MDKHNQELLQRVCERSALNRRDLEEVARYYGTGNVAWMCKVGIDSTFVLQGVIDAIERSL